MSLYYLILWNQVAILQKHFIKDHVHMRLWMMLYGIYVYCVRLLRDDTPLWKCKAGLKLAGCSPGTDQAVTHWSLFP